MEVVWLNEAQNDFKEAVRYVRRNDPQATRRFYETVRQQVKQLGDYPESARPGRVEGTRELEIMQFPFIVVYYVKGREVRILAVLHAARKWPDSFSDG